MYLLQAPAGFLQWLHFRIHDMSPDCIPDPRCGPKVDVKRARAGFLVAFKTDAAHDTVLEV